MAKKNMTTEPTVERSIHFYRADVGADKNGRPLQFDPKPALSAITALPFDNVGRYQAIEDGNSISVWVDRATSTGRLRLGTVRRNGLPPVEQNGRLSELTIPANAGLAEQIYVVFFANNIVGADFNFYGPRVSRLGAYLWEKARNSGPKVVFEPLIRRDVSEQLNRLTDIRLFSLRIRSSFAATIAKADKSLGAAFAAAKKMGDVQDLEIVLRPRRYSRESMGGRLLAAAKKIARIDGLREEAQNFQLKGLDSETDKVHLVDVLSDKLIVKKRIMQQDSRTRALDPASAYFSISAAYAEISNELDHAAGVVT